MKEALKILKARKELKKLTYNFTSNKWQSLEETILDMLSTDNDDTNLYSFVKYLIGLDKKNIGLIKDFLIQSGYVIWSYKKIIKDIQDKESILYLNATDEDREKIVMAEILGSK